MDLYDHPTFQMACRQFDLVAHLLQIPESDRAWLKYPKRSMSVSLPVRTEDGRTEVFFGHRVQHHLTLGPTKGGLRYHPEVTLGEVAALAMWMSWKCALTGLPQAAVAWKSILKRTDVLGIKTNVWPNIPTTPQIIVARPKSRTVLLS